MRCVTCGATRPIVVRRPGSASGFADPAGWNKREKTVWVAGSASARTQGTDQGGDHLVQVADDGVVGVGQDRGAGVGVDRDDVLGSRAARDVLNGAADPAGQVELRGDLGAGLADLLLVRAP